MEAIDLKIKFGKNTPILALGPESAGNFSVCFNGKIFCSRDFGDLLEEKNFIKFKKEVLFFLRKNKINPAVILTDMHPLYKTTLWGAELAKKFSVKHIQIQHHLAHIFCAIGESLGSKAPKFIGIACDGTGYGLNGKIWGGECFAISNFKFLISKQIQSSKLKITRLGHLENQIMIGGDLAIREPARMLISILDKIRNPKSEIRNKDFVYGFVKRYYTHNQFELLYNQLKQGFNCQETSSTGRVLDAVSFLLGFSGNERKYKHSPIDFLEKNSTTPYKNIKPKISILKNDTKNRRSLKIVHILETTPLFEYLAKNLNKDKRRLAATAQLYIAEGLYEIAKSAAAGKTPIIYFSGGIANNKIISSYFESKGAIMNKKIPRGDAGISFGQIIYCLLTDSRN